MPEKIELRKLVMCFTTSFKVLLSCKWSCFISRINLFEDHRSNFFFFHCQRPWPFCWWLFLTASSIFYSFDSVEMWWSMWSSSTFRAREGKPSRGGMKICPRCKRESLRGAGQSCNHPDSTNNLENAGALLSTCWCFLLLFQRSNYNLRQVWGFQKK